MYIDTIEIDATLYTPAFDDLPVTIDTPPPIEMIDIPLFDLAAIAGVIVMSDSLHIVSPCRPGISNQPKSAVIAG